MSSQRLERSCEKSFKNRGAWHVPFIKCKRFILKRSKLGTGHVLLKGEVHYMANTGIYRSVCKNGKFTNMISPKDISSGLVTLKPTKVKDVNKLLTTHFDKERLEKLRGTVFL